MNDPDTPFWTLDDYRRFLRHEDYFARYWAADRIDEQFPDRKAEEFLPLLTDEDDGLQIRAAQAIAASGQAERYEQDLLAAREGSTGLAHDWMTIALGRGRSGAILPELVAAVDEADARKPATELYDEIQAALAALAHYPDAEARDALWRFVERYPAYDIVFEKAAAALLENPDHETLPRLLKRWAGLPDGEHLPWYGLASTLTRPLGLDRVAEDISAGMKEPPAEVAGALEQWMDQPVPMSAAFIDAFYAAGQRGYKGLLPAISAEFAGLTRSRGDDWEGWVAAWQAGSAPTGYRWRMVYTGQLITALAGAAVTQPRRYRDMAAVGFVALAQAALDEDDEKLLASAGNDLGTLLDILGSERMNVMPDVAERVAAFGAAAVPRLIDILRGVESWSQPRALEAIGIIARRVAGGANAAAEAVLDLIHEDQDEDTLELASDALTSIGAAVVAPAAARFGRDDSYDIYVPSALSEIPMPAALEAMLRFVREGRKRDLVDDLAVENLGHFGRMETMRLLREYDADDRGAARVLYTTGLLNEDTGPEMERWRANALAEQERLENFTRDADSLIFREAAREADARTPGGKQPSRRSVQREKKKRRTQAKATKKAQKKKKKKR